MDRDTIAKHIQAMRQTPGFAILMERWNTIREGIIAEGKSARKEEKTIKMWARLEGFDDAVHTIAELSKGVEVEAPGPEIDD